MYQQEKQPYSSVPDIIVHQAGVYKLLHNTHQHKAIDPATIPGKLLRLGTFTFDKSPESFGVAGVIVI
jgi:hypothetical protein